MDKYTYYSSTTNNCPKGVWLVKQMINKNINIVTEILSENGPTAAPMQNASSAEDVGVEFCYYMPSHCPFPWLKSIAGSRELCVQDFAEQGKDRVKDTAQDKTIPRRKVLFAMVHVGPGASPMCNHQRRNDQQRQNCVSDVQKSLRSSIYCLCNWLVLWRKIHAVYGTAREQVTDGALPSRIIVVVRLIVVAHGYKGVRIPR